ncbi:ABC transporter permease [Halotalea alkalilenta]|uniref:ABC transporter permease n=1 Tax=Halotalea alkalilenta TaxID=376489 RepID=UPI0004807E19|nr:ABC transporter permease subunit [Halotalea alkalilenta]
MKKMRAMTNLLGCLLLLVVWQAAGAELSESLLATPLQVFVALNDTLLGNAFWAALGSMLWQMSVGYALALLVGVPLGVAMGRLPLVRALVKPWAAMFIVVSAAALVPLFILLLGRGVLLCVAIVFVATVWFVVTTMMEASRSVSPNLLDVARSYGASPLQVFRLVLLPALHPYVLIAARIGLTHALRAMVTAEMFISTGYGGLINDAGLDLSTAPLFGLIVMLMLLSVTATGLLRWVANRTAPWYASRTGDH